MKYTNYPARIPPGHRHCPTSRATPHSFLPPHRTVNTVRAIPIPPPPISLPQTTLLQTLRTINTIQTNRATPRRTHTRTITNLSNQRIIISACLTTLRLITSPTLWPTTPTTTSIIPTATTCNSRSNSSEPLSLNRSGPPLSNVIHSGERRSVHMPLPAESFSLFQYFHDYPTVIHPIHSLRENFATSAPSQFHFSHQTSKCFHPFHSRFIHTSRANSYNRML